MAVFPSVGLGVTVFVAGVCAASAAFFLVGIVAFRSLAAAALAAAVLGVEVLDGAGIVVRCEAAAAAHVGSTRAGAASRRVPAEAVFAFDLAAVALPGAVLPGAVLVAVGFVAVVLVTEGVGDAVLLAVVLAATGVAAVVAAGLAAAFGAAACADFDTRFDPLAFPAAIVGLDLARLETPVTSDCVRNAVPRVGSTETLSAASRGAVLATAFPRAGLVGRRAALAGACATDFVRREGDATIALFFDGMAETTPDRPSAADTIERSALRPQTPETLAVTSYAFSDDWTEIHPSGFKQGVAGRPRTWCSGKNSTVNDWISYKRLKINEYETLRRGAPGR